jgi:hemerythrin-like metal-binding protein
MRFSINDKFSDGDRLESIKKDNLMLLRESEKAVVAMQQESERRVQTLIVTQVIGLAIGIAAIIWALIVVVSLLRKIAAINSLTAEFAQGNLTKRIEVRRKDDELDDTIGGVNVLGENIAGIVSEIYSANNTLISVSRDFAGAFDAIATNAEQMKNHSETVAAAAEEASTSVKSISGNAEQMSLSVSTVASSMEEMSASINEVAKNCQQESRIAAQAEHKVNSSKETMTYLKASAKEIGRIISVITDIADRTNLLALNATIEAATAGEMGKGFAVVANEVKSLAKQTAEAANEIRRQIETMQSRTEESVGNMEEIAQVINEVNTISQTIVAAVEQQSATINEVAKTIAGASRFAQEIANNVAETSIGISEVSSNIQSVNKETGEVTDGIVGSKDKVARLGQLGEDLRNVVSMFRIQTAFITWTDELSVRVREIDNQHKTLIGMINELNSALSAGNAKETLSGIIARLIDYTGSHFALEEKYMKQFAYPEYDAHKRAHTAFVDKVVSFKNEFEQGTALLSKDIMIFLKKWLTEHIMGIDKKYSAHFNKNGLR